MVTKLVLIPTEFDSQPFDFSLANINLKLSNNMGRILVWNVRGVQHSDFKKLWLELISREKVKGLILIETHVDGDKAKQITNSLPFSNVEMMNTIGFASGIWLLWNSFEVEVQVVNKSKQEIHAIVKVSPNSPNWLLSGIYASPKLANRKILWKILKSIANVNSLLWLILGNFNDVLC